MAYKRDVRDFRQSINARGKKTRNPGWQPGNHWVQCDRCASAIRASDAMITWDNLIVCPDDWEIRHPQDFVRGRADDIAAKEPRRSESQDVFVTTNTGTGTSPTPEPPRILSAEVSGFSGSTATVTLLWTDAPLADSYKVYRDSVFVSNVTTGRAFVDTPGADGDYSYTVSSVNSFGEGSQSDPFVATVPATGTGVLSPDNPDLFVFYTFDDIIGSGAGASVPDNSTVLPDQNGTLQGSPAPTIITGLSGDALEFSNGLNANLLLAFASPPTDDTSISFWLNKSVAVTGREIIWLRGGSGESFATNQFWIGYESDGNFSMFTERGNSGETDNLYTTTIPVIVDSSWHNYVHTVDNGVWNIYIDGVDQNLNQSILPTQTGASTSLIGSAFGNFSHLQADMDQFRVFNTVVTADEISDLANEFSAP